LEEKGKDRVKWPNRPFNCLPKEEGHRTGYPLSPGMRCYIGGAEKGKRLKKVFLFPFKK
jgi:hypothetical protein